MNQRSNMLTNNLLLKKDQLVCVKKITKTIPKMISKSDGIKVRNLTLWRPLLPYGYIYIKHPVPDFICNFWHFWMSKITNDGLTRGLALGALYLQPYGNSGRQRVKYSYRTETETDSDTCRGSEDSTRSWCSRESRRLFQPAQSLFDV